MDDKMMIMMAASQQPKVDTGQQTFSDIYILQDLSRLVTFR